MDREQEIVYFERKPAVLRKTHGLPPARWPSVWVSAKKTMLALESGTIPPRLSCVILFRIEWEFGIAPRDMFKAMDSE